MSTDGFQDAALVVLGHGTALNDDSALPVRRHAAELRRRGVFREVREAFWKQEPQVQDVLASLAVPRVFIVPVFVSEGYFSTEVIPSGLGFAYPDRLAIRSGARDLFYCRPVGTHPRMATVVLERAAEVALRFPFPRPPRPAATTLFLAGHGTARHINSRAAIERHAASLRALRVYADVHAVFMEEEPLIRQCWRLAATKNIIVVPFFIGDGLHAAEDIPVLLGEPEHLVRERVASGQPAWTNPAEREGRRIWYATSVGTAPLLADVILERAAEALDRGRPPG